MAGFTVCGIDGHDTTEHNKGVFTLSETKNENDTEKENDNYGFHYNMQSISHCTETLSLIPLATFSYSIGLGISLVLSVAQCEYTIKQHETTSRGPRQYDRDPSVKHNTTMNYKLR